MNKICTDYKIVNERNIQKLFPGKNNSTFTIISRNYRLRKLAQRKSDVRYNSRR